MKLVLAAVLALSAAVQSQDPVREQQLLLEKARALRTNSQLLPQAREFYEEWLRRFPKSNWAPDVMIELAQSYGPFAPDKQKAVGWLRKVVEQYPGTTHEQAALQAVQTVAGWTFSQVPDDVAPGAEAGVRVSRRGGAASRFVLFRRPSAEFLRQLETAPLENFSPDVPSERWVRISEETVVFEDRGQQQVEKELKLDLREPGRYRLEETIDGFRTLHGIRSLTFDVFVRALGGRAVAFAYEAPSGRPLEGVSLRMRRAAGIVEARSGADGIAWFDLAPAETGVVIAARGGEVQYVDLRYDAPLQEALVYITTDRPVYRPGQIVFWKALLRDRKGDRLLLRAGAKSRAEIRDPDGRVLQAGEFTWNDAGAISGSFRLGDEPPLGHYQVVVREKRVRSWGVFLDEGEEDPWRKEFRVAAYRKPDARVTVEFADLRPVVGAKVKAKIRAEYFFGGPVANADVVWEVVSPYEREDSGWPKPPFEDPHAWFYAPLREDDSWEPDPDAGDGVAEGEGKTGPDGTLEIEFPTDGSPKMRPYVVRATVTDESRRGSSGSARITVAPSSLKLSVGTPRLFYTSGDGVQARVRVTDLEGKPQKERAVEFAAFVAEQNGDDGVEFESFFTAKSQTDGAGYASFAFPIDRSGRIRVRARARDDQGRAVEDRADFWSAGEGVPAKEDQDLEVLPDRVVYEAGDTIRLMVRTPKKPLQALLTIEGGGIQEARVVELRRFNEVLELPARAGFAPNAFIKLVAWKDGAVLGGGFEVLVLPKERFLDVAVTTDRANYGPRAKARVSVAVTAQGAAAPGEVELAVIDESILYVEKDLTPDIRLFFNRRRHDGGACIGSGNFVDSYDSFDSSGRRNVRMGGALTGATFALEEAKEVPAGAAFAHAETRRFFPDTLHWSAHLKTGPDGRVEAEIETPDSLTTWRVLARAVSGADRTGTGVSSMLTRKDVIVRLSAPRFYTERDAGTVSTIVHNDLPRETEFTVRLAVEGGEGGGERKVTVPSKGVRRDDWTVRAPRAGTMKLRAEALSRAESDVLEIELPVKPHGIERHAVKSGAVAGSWAADLVLPAGAPPENASLEVTVTAGTMSAVLEALPFLAGYPYGCVEQTMSRFLPSVTAAAALKRLGMSNEGLEKTLPDMVSKGLQRLYGFQHEDGGWGWWKQDATHPFMTAYALFGLVSARRAGFAVDEETIRRGLDELQAMDLTPFSLYVLSLAGRDVKEETQFFPVPAEVEGVAYLVLAGRKDLLPRLKLEGDVPGPGAVRTWGLVLRAVAGADPNDARVGALVERLLGSRRGHAWYSTLDSAWAVFGLAEAAAGEKEPEAIRVSVNGREVSARSGRVRADARAGANRIEVTERGGTRVFASALLRYVTGEEGLAAEKGAITVGRVFERAGKNDQGDVEWRRLKSGEAVRSGEEIRVRVTISGEARADYVMVESPIAAGTEPWDPPPDEFDWATSWYGRRELRDDRVAVAGANVWRDWNTFDFILVPTQPGEYHVLPAVAFAMYDPDRRGWSDEFLLRVADR